MRREEAEAERERLQLDDHQHTYVVREQPSGEWEVVRINIPRPTSVAVAARRAPSPTTDAEQTAELADAARRLNALREGEPDSPTYQRLRPRTHTHRPSALPLGFGWATAAFGLLSVEQTPPGGLF